MMSRIALISSLAIACASCVNGRNSEPVADVVPLYDIIGAFSALDDAAKSCALSDDSAEFAAFMSVVSGEPLDVSLVESWASSKAVEVFTPVVDSVFDGASVAGDLGHILAAAKDHGLELPRRRYAEVVYGRPESILFVDSVMLIALNHYLGSDFAGYTHLPLYMRMVKTPSMLPYDMAEAIVGTSYPYQPAAGSTVLSRLLYEGALAYAKEKLVRGADPALCLGYAPEQYKWLDHNEKDIWATMVAKGILFDTAESAASRMVDPAPTTPDIAPEAPGRLGRFVGYRMVKSYIDHNPGQADLPYLLSPEFYNNPAILQRVSYNP